MQVLQDSLQNLISGTSEVNVDLVTEAVYFRSKAGFQVGALKKQRWNRGELLGPKTEGVGWSPMGGLDVEVCNG